MQPQGKTLKGSEYMPQITVEQIKQGGYIFTPRIAKRDFRSCVSGRPIPTGEEYYQVILGGGGLQWIAHPDRIHINEIEQYLMKWGINR